MAIEAVLFLLGISAALGLLSRTRQRTNLIMAASWLLLHWLQPETNLRHLGYWAPIFSLAVIFLTWAAITPRKNRIQPETFQSLGMLLILELLIQVFSYLEPFQELGLNASPVAWIAVLAWSLLTGAAYLLLNRRGNSPWLSWVPFAILIAILIVLKSPSLAETASRVWRSITGQSPQLARAAELQWLGYSYLAFRLLHTIRDCQAGRYSPVQLNTFIAYSIFFPSVLAGPIARIDQVQGYLHQPAGTLRDDYSAGIERILIGLFKKYLVADSLAVFALDSQSALQATSSSGAWILLYAYSLQIFLDFSGYTDIAIGLARFLGIKLPENFNRPYLKPNLTQFWSSWHMTLTNWFRAYFFNPVSRSLRKRKLPALLILLITQVSTMVLVGLWHGITLNFVIWGAWHGLGLLIQNRWSAWIKNRLPPSGQKQPLQKALAGLNILLTFHFVTLGWIWFTLPTPELANGFILLLLGVSP